MAHASSPKGKAGPAIMAARGLKRGELRADPKDASAVILLKSKAQLARLDVWPFLVLYACVLGAGISFAVSFQW